MVSGRRSHLAVDAACVHEEVPFHVFGARGALGVSGHLVEGEGLRGGVEGWGGGWGGGPTFSGRGTRLASAVVCVVLEGG